MSLDYDGIGYHTPDVEKFGSVDDSRIVTLPLSLWYLVNGALEELTFPENWTQFGSATPEETAEFFTKRLDVLRPYPMIGSIVPLVISSFPDYILPCDGSIFNREDYPVLYDSLDPGLIVDADTFKTPDLTGRFLLADGYGRDLMDVGGSEAHILTIAEMPTHVHGYVSAIGSVSTVVVPDEPSAVPAPSVTEPEGGSQPHNNMPPYYVVRYGLVAK